MCCAVHARRTLRCDPCDRARKERSTLFFRMRRFEREVEKVRGGARIPIFFLFCLGMSAITQHCCPASWRTFCFPPPCVHGTPFDLARFFFSLCGSIIVEIGEEEGGIILSDVRGPSLLLSDLQVCRLFLCVWLPSWGLLYRFCCSTLGSVFWRKRGKRVQQYSRS